MNATKRATRERFRASRRPISFTLLLVFLMTVIPQFPMAAAQGEDGTVSMSSPTSGQSFAYSSSRTITVSCSSTKPAHADPEFGGAGMRFAVDTGSGYNFGTAYDGVGEYSVTLTMPQWGITGPGSYSAR